MLRQLSNVPPRPEGKKSGEQTKKMITTQYNLGKPEWQQDWVSQTKQQFQPSQEIKYERVKRNINQGTFQIGQDKTDYTSNAKANFQDFSQNHERAKPLKSRVELQATQYDLGTDKIAMQTAVQNQFAHPKQQPANPQHSLTYKNYNMKVDVFTGQVLNKNQKMSGYEGYTEQKQSRFSNNQFQLPQDLYVTDPITGRQIARK